MTNYGNAASTNYTCAISTTIGGGGAGSTTATPTGDIIYIQCKSVKGKESFNEKWTDIVGGSSIFIPLGKKKMSISLDGIFMIKVAAGTNTEEARNVLDYIRKTGRSGSSYLYLFVHNWADNKDLYLSYSSGGNSQNYLKGVIQGQDWSLGVVTEITGLKFIGV